MKLLKKQRNKDYHFVECKTKVINYFWAQKRNKKRPQESYINFSGD